MARVGIFGAGWVGLVTGACFALRSITRTGDRKMSQPSNRQWKIIEASHQTGKPSRRRLAEAGAGLPAERGSALPLGF